MAARTPYPCRIVTPDDTVFEGEVQTLLVTGTGGELGLLARHTPLVADLRMGHAKVQLPDDSWRSWATLEGFVAVHDSTGTVLVEDAVDIATIDAAEAQSMIDEAREDLATAESGGDDPVYRADAEKALKQIAWGEHLLMLTASGDSH